MPLDETEIREIIEDSAFAWKVEELMAAARPGIRMRSERCGMASLPLGASRFGGVPDLPGEVEIIPEEGRAYTTGIRYLLFPTMAPSPLVDEPCSATVRWSEDLAELRPATARVPGASPAQDADLPWEWVIAAAVIVGAVGLARRLIDRRRHPEPDWNPDFTFESEDG